MRPDQSPALWFRAQRRAGLLFCPLGTDRGSHCAVQYVSCGGFVVECLEFRFSNVVVHIQQSACTDAREGGSYSCGRMSRKYKAYRQAVLSQCMGIHTLIVHLQQPATPVMANVLAMEIVCLCVATRSQEAGNLKRQSKHSTGC